MDGLMENPSIEMNDSGTPILGNLHRTRIGGGI